MDPSTRRTMPSEAPSAPVDSAPPTPGKSDETREFTPQPITGSLVDTSITSFDDAQASMLFGPGKIVDGYVILEQIGRGGMGIVYRAKQPQTGQLVALKMIRDKSFAEADSLERFLREVQALGRVQPVKNVVPIYVVGQHEHHPYFVMQYLAGGTLATRMKSLRDEPAKAVAIVAKIARAVHHLHQRQILHRDIKPANILLDADGEPYLGDFGLIKLLDDDQGLTQTQQRLGTPAYMAPEQTGLLPKPATAQTDIWALGAILYEVLAGIRPFHAPKDQETSTLLWRIVHEAPPRPCKVNPRLDPGLEAVILKCLEKDPADRFATAEELANELERWLEKGIVQTRRTPVRRFLARHRFAVAFLVLVIAAVSAIVAWNRLNAEPTPEEALKLLQDKFRDEGKLELVPEMGRPRWQQLAIANDDVKSDKNHQGYWRIDSSVAGVVELFRFRDDIPPGPYKVRAELAHFDSLAQVNGAYVGVFINHSAESDDRKTPHALCNLVYNDIYQAKDTNGNAIDNSAILKYRLYRDTGVQAPVDDLIGWTKPAVFTYAGPGQPRWRVVEMESHPDRIVCQFDGQPMDPLKRADADGEFQKWFTKVQRTFPARYGPIGDMTNIKPSHRGSLGLVVSRGSIVVRSVTLTRLPDPN